MSRIKSVDRGNDRVVYGGATVERTPGWKIVFDQSVIYDVTMSSTGQYPVSFVRCKPYSYSDGLGDWEANDYFKLQEAWKPEKREYYVYAYLLERPNGEPNLSSEEGRSNADVLSEGSPASGVTLTWWTTDGIQAQLTLRAR